MKLQRSFFFIMCYFQTFVIITDTSGNFELLFWNICLRPPLSLPAALWQHHCLYLSPLHSSLFMSSQFSSWHCPRRPLHRPHSCTPLFTWDHWLKTWQNAVTWCLHACDASLGPPPLRKCSRPFSHPRALLQRAGHYNWIQLPFQSIPHWFQPLPGYRLPQTMRLCYNFRLAGAMGIKLWTTKAVYGRTEEPELHNRQLPCPLTPPPSPSFNLWSVCRWVWLGTD